MRAVHQYLSSQLLNFVCTAKAQCFPISIRFTSTNTASEFQSHTTATWRELPSNTPKLTFCRICTSDPPAHVHKLRHKPLQHESCFKTECLTDPRCSDAKDVLAHELIQNHNMTSESQHKHSLGSRTVQRVLFSPIHRTVTRDSYRRLNRQKLSAAAHCCTLHPGVSNMLHDPLCVVV
jgi:hypothetical protein